MTTIGLKRKKAVPHSEGQPFLAYINVRGLLITERLLLSKRRLFREQLLRWQRT